VVESGMADISKKLEEGTEAILNRSGIVHYS
jgi:hypothetical protein